MEIADVTMGQLALGAPLGDGASGDVFASSFQGARCLLTCGRHRRLCRFSVRTQTPVVASYANTGRGKLQPLAGNRQCWKADAQRAVSHKPVPDSVIIAAGHEVAVKVFKGEASPDGRAADEIDVTCAVAHANLIRVIGLVQQPHALVVHKVGSLQKGLKVSGFKLSTVQADPCTHPGLVSAQR